jgi:hypothetical protein
MIIRSPHLQPGEFVFGDAKKLLRHYLPDIELTCVVRMNPQSTRARVPRDGRTVEI